MKVAKKKSMPVVTDSSSSKSIRFFVGGLCRKIQIGDVTRRFEEFGEVLKCSLGSEGRGGRVRKDKYCGHPGYLFFSLKSEHSPEEIISKVTTIKDIEITCQVAMTKSEAKVKNKEKESGKIFVGGLPKDLNDQVFSSHFEKFGKIEKGYIARDLKTRRTRGFGFIIFEKESSKKSAIKAKELIINGHSVQIRDNIPKYAYPSDQTTSVEKSLQVVDLKTTDKEIIAKDRSIGIRANYPNLHLFVEEAKVERANPAQSSKIHNSRKKQNKEYLLTHAIEEISMVYRPPSPEVEAPRFSLGRFNTGCLSNSEGLEFESGFQFTLC